jgi:CRISPR-associated protein Cas1
MRMLATAGVLVGFCGGGGTPLLMATEVEWLSPQSEYRPTEYLQGWMQFWFDEDMRLEAARHLQQARVRYLQTVWGRDRDLNAEGFSVGDLKIKGMLEKFSLQIGEASSVSKLLQNEALLTKRLYKIAAQRTQLDSFSRQRDATDKANLFLNHGNYLAYGLAATTLWVLGIPHGFAVMHGKTRRGALIFDVADLVKDALILPLAFVCAKENVTEQEFRMQCLQLFTQHKALDFMFEEIKSIALTKDWRVRAA